jgi:hypothetical protein
MGVQGKRSQVGGVLISAAGRAEEHPLDPLRCFGFQPRKHSAPGFFRYSNSLRTRFPAGIARRLAIHFCRTNSPQFHIAAKHPVALFTIYAYFSVEGARFVSLKQRTTFYYERLQRQVDQEHYLLLRGIAQQNTTETLGEQNLCAVYPVPSNTFTFIDILNLHQKLSKE